MITETLTKRPTYYEELRGKGYSRRDFMKYCTMMAAFMGLQQSGIAQIADAMKKTPRIPVIWLTLCSIKSRWIIRKR
jgi:hydrogenase small subunit